jgi:hypothetical protein
MDILSVLDYSFTPKENQLAHLSSIMNFNFVPDLKRLNLEPNLYGFLRPMKRFT